MPRNLAGLYSLPAGSIVADGVDDILASQHNTPLQDIAATLNTALPVAVGGTGATTKLGAQQALDLEPGVDVQAYDAGLQSIAGLSWVADRYPYTTGVDTFALGTITSFGRSILDDVDAAAALTTLTIGGDIPAVEALSGTGLAVRTGTNTWATRTITSPDSSVTITNPGGVAGDVELSIGATFVSTEFTPVAEDRRTLAHGLPAAPTDIRLILRCNTAERNFAVNDTIVLHPGMIDLSTGHAVQATADGTNIYYANYLLWVRNKTTGTGSGAWAEITYANWRARVVARV